MKQPNVYSGPPFVVDEIQREAHADYETITGSPNDKRFDRWAFEVGWMMGWLAAMDTLTHDKIIKAVAKNVSEKYPKESK